VTVLAGLGPERVSESAVAEMLVRHINWHHWQATDSGRNGNFSCLLLFYLAMQEVASRAILPWW
jgi:hypothetical protein